MLNITAHSIVFAPHLHTLWHDSYFSVCVCAECEVWCLWRCCCSWLWCSPLWRARDPKVIKASLSESHWFLKASHLFTVFAPVTLELECGFWAREGGKRKSLRQDTQLHEPKTRRTRLHRVVFTLTPRSPVDTSISMLVFSSDSSL